MAEHTPAEPCSAIERQALAGDVARRIGRKPRRGLGDLRRALGEPGASSRAAAEILSILEGGGG